jgi:hypothetical protein
VFETIFNSTDLGTTLEIDKTLICILAALLMGFVISIDYYIITLQKDRSRSMAVSLVVLPAVISVVIILVGGSIARAFSMAGVFALIRFRSAPGDAKDITFVFTAMAAGLSVGMGYLTLGAAVTVIICLVMFVICKLGYGMPKRPEKVLRITIPEDMNTQGLFDDLLDKYTSKSSLYRVRSINLGTLYELTYNIVLKNEGTEKELIDELRCRNGNLNIQITVREAGEQQL